MTTTTPNSLLYTITTAFSSTKKTNSHISFASSRNSISDVNIRHPDLYVDDHLTVHGIDDVLDPSSATKCSIFSNPTTQIKLQIDQSLLDLAIKALKMKGFSVVATAMAIKSSDLMYFGGVTVFAPSDVKLFSFPNGFRYVFRYHIVTKHLRFADIAKLPVETEMETIDPEKMLVIGFINGVPSLAPTYSTIGSEDSGIAVLSTASSYSGNLEESSTAMGLLDPKIERMLDKLRRYPFYPSHVPHVTLTVKILDGIGKVGQKCTTAISLCLYESKIKLHGQKCN